MGRRGKIKTVDRTPHQVVFAPRGEHSMKPQEVHHRIHKLMGYQPSLELFSRRPIVGWTCIGNDARSTGG